jgi:hypothetical protein
MTNISVPVSAVPAGFGQGHGRLAACWPGLADRQVTVGGSPVSYAEAVRAAEVLAASRTSAIAPVLRAARSALAGCDYFGAADPWIEQARRAPKTGRVGAAGRHVTKHAFLAAISAALAAAEQAEMASWQAALGTDERYAAAIAADAAALRERAHAAGLRSALRSAVTRAVASCTAAAGQLTCTAETACGTGTCPFAQAPYRVLTAVAGPGRTGRPGNHVRAGEGFSEAAAAQELAQLVPWRAGVPVADCHLPARGAA